MNNIGKYCLGGFALAVVGFLCWYFSSIIAYILIARDHLFFGTTGDELFGALGN